MKNKFFTLTLYSIFTILSGCATNSGPSMTAQAMCFIAMSAAGTTAGGLADDDNVGPAAGGLVIGAALGYMLCQEDDSPEPIPQETSAPGDADGDGVTDNNDRCPGTPRGTRVDSMGCTLDSDGDGVADGRDQCPGTPRGIQVNSSGCEMDDDRDGVVNRMDDCPGTPSGQSVNDMGCHIIFTLTGVTFQYNSSALTNEARSTLNEVVQMLRENSSTNIRIEGHTDSQGADAYNQDLSQRRAQSVLDFLVLNGISRSRLTAVGRGENSPIADNSTEAGRARNRRVEFIINN